MIYSDFIGDIKDKDINVDNFWWDKYMDKQ